MTTKISLLAASLFLPVFISAQNVIPEPAQYRPAKGEFVLSIAENKAFETNNVLPSRVVQRIAPDCTTGADEAYRLEITPDSVFIQSATVTGVFRGEETLKQLLRFGKGTTSACVINDAPRYSWRGFMLDESRHFFGKEKVKQLLDIMASLRLNVFHWHLTENQSWRLQSKIFPMLNDSVNTTRMPGKYYTLEEAKDLVAFCKAHNILLIPEFDMPGHSEAFVRTFRHDMQSKEGMAILKLLMDEVCEVFEEVPYLHIGTDEVKFTNPKFVPEMEVQTG